VKLFFEEIFAKEKKRPKNFFSFCFFSSQTWCFLLEKNFLIQKKIKNPISPHPTEILTKKIFS